MGVESARVELMSCLPKPNGEIAYSPHAPAAFTGRLHLCGGELRM
jgi:hypothetical protein